MMEQLYLYESRLKASVTAIKPRFSMIKSWSSKRKILVCPSILPCDIVLAKNESEAAGKLLEENLAFFQKYPNPIKALHGYIGSIMDDIKSRSSKAKEKIVDWDKLGVWSDLSSVNIIINSMVDASTITTLPWDNLTKGSFCRMGHGTQLEVQGHLLDVADLRNQLIESYPTDERIYELCGGTYAERKLYSNEINKEAL